jgi:hypothetical protein
VEKVVWGAAFTYNFYIQCKLLCGTRVCSVRNTHSDVGSSKRHDKVCFFTVG